VERGLIFVKGSVPGHKGGWLLVKDAVKHARPDTAPYPASLKAAANDTAPRHRDDAAAASSVVEAPAETPEG